MADLPRIAYLTALYPAVSHTFILREVQGLRELGLEVETISVRRPGKEHLLGDAEAHAERTTYYLLDAAKRSLALPAAILSALGRPTLLLQTLKLTFKMRAPGLKTFVYQMFYLAEALILARYLRRNQIVHLHSHFAQASATVALLASRQADITFSFTLHGPADFYDTGRWHLSDKLSAASFVACISHYARSQAMLVSDPSHWDRFRIVHCGVIPELYAPEGNQERSSETVNLLFVGRLAPVKGVRLLLAAFANALERHPAMRLTIVGDGEDRIMLEQIAEPLGDAVRFTGYLSQSEVAKEMANADAFVLPSFAEGLPVVLMEALAAQKTAIATRVAGVAELVENKKTGFLIHAGDIDGLQDAIETFASTPQKWRHLGVAGQARVSKEFDARTEAARIARLFVDGPGDKLRPEPLNVMRQCDE
ncbi:MAG: glycosyltransferase [Pseudomonadota bacterium]